MTDEWRRVSDLFDWATALRTEDRHRFLDFTCGDDVHLRQEVESLLHADAVCPGDAFLRRSIRAARAALRADHPPKPVPPPG